jgi:hypothetical protein
MRRLRPLVLLLGLLLLVAASSPATAQEDAGNVSIRLLDAPSDRQDDPRARVYVVDHLQPGEAISRRLEVGNTTASAIELELYAASARVEEGQFLFGDGRDGNELTSWTRVEPSTVRVPAGGTAEATVRIQVPADAVDGERYGVIWAQTPSSGGATAVVNRVGIRMYLSVGTGEEPKSDLRIDTLTAAREADGRPTVRTTVTNTGGRALDLSGELQLSDGPGSLSAGPFELELGTTLAPGERAPAIVHLDEDLPAGPWTARVTVRAGELEREAEATITFPEEAGSTAQPVTAKGVEQQRKVLLPVAGVLAAGVLGGLAAYAIRSLRAKRRAGGGSAAD